MINYNNITKSIDYYSTWYKRVEVPWTVTEEISSITKPKGAKDFKLIHDNGKVLVASAEQSFLYQYSKGYLPKGKFQTVTPCFRNENFDESHSKYFIKNELIVTNFERNVHLEYFNIVAQALGFFRPLFKHPDNVRIKSITDNSCDIVYISFYGEIESGSYGIRSCSFLEWIYGTGCAEPRLSYVLEIDKREYGVSLNRY